MKNLVLYHPKDRNGEHTVLTTLFLVLSSETVKEPVTAELLVYTAAVITGELVCVTLIRPRHCGREDCKSLSDK